MIQLITSRLWLIIGFISLFSLSVAIGTAIYKKIPVDLWGLKIGNQVAGQTDDFPFLVNEVQQLKEQRQLLETRLVKLLKENEVQKNRLKECEGELS